MYALLKRMRDEDAGFTLVEMLVVVAIMGVLASVAVVAVGGTASQSKIASCKSDMATVQSASDSYYAKNSAYAPTLAALATSGFLRTDPSTKTVASDGYQLSYTVGTGVVGVTPAACAIP